MLRKLNLCYRNNVSSLTVWGKNNTFENRRKSSKFNGLTFYIKLCGWGFHFSCRILEADNFMKAPQKIWSSWPVLVIRVFWSILRRVWVIFSFKSCGHMLLHFGCGKILMWLVLVFYQSVSVVLDSNEQRVAD